MSDKDHDGKASPERGPFLARWSKRKIDNTRRTLPDKSSQLPQAHQADSTIEQPFDPKAFELPVPELEDIVAGFDMRPFLQKGVPEHLKNAALRKLWVTDPAIAGFVSPALDYAHDYNTPGAAPGFGPLIGDHDLTSLMENLFSRDPQDKTPQEPREQTQTLPSPPMETLPASPQTPLPALQAAAPAAQIQTDQNKIPDPTPVKVSAPKSRHGSALPE